MTGQARQPSHPSEEDLSSEDAPEEDTYQSSNRFKRIWHYAHRKIPAIVSDPNYTKRLAVYRRSDVKKNLRTEPPADEVIDLLCVWAIEFYPPSHIEKLRTGFSKLGWDDGNAGLHDSPTQWIRQLRESSMGGDWFNLGVIERDGVEHFFGHQRTATLPANVEYAIGSLYGLTPSITCIVMCFVLTEEHSCSFDQILRKKYQTKITPTRDRRGYRIYSPTQQKLAEIGFVRESIRKSSADWFRAYLPGLFSSGLLKSEVPTCEFVTFKKGHPFPKVQDGAGPEKYLRLLDMDYSAEAWESVDISGLKFAWPMLRDSETGFHAVIAMNEEDIDKGNLKAYGEEDDRSSYVTCVNEHVNELLSRWSLLAVLSGFERHLNATRDSAIFQPGGRQKPERLLETLTALLTQSGDISAASSDLAQFVKHKGMFSDEMAAFKPCNLRSYQDENTELGETLRHTIAERSAWIHYADKSVRDLVTQYGNSVSALENIRLQKWRIQLRSA